MCARFRLQAELEVPTVVAGHDMTVKVSRAKFEELITPYIARTYKYVLLAPSRWRALQSADG